MSDLRQFVHDEIERNTDGYHVKLTDVYDRYVQWSKKRGETPVKAPSFHRELVPLLRGLTGVYGVQTRGYTGKDRRYSWVKLRQEPGLVEEILAEMSS